MTFSKLFRRQSKPIQVEPAPVPVVRHGGSDIWAKDREMKEALAEKRAREQMDELDFIPNGFAYALMKEHNEPKDS